MSDNSLFIVFYRNTMSVKFEPGIFICVFEYMHIKLEMIILQGICIHIIF